MIRYDALEEARFHVPVAAMMGRFQNIDVLLPALSVSIPSATT